MFSAWCPWSATLSRSANNSWCLLFVTAPMLFCPCGQRPTAGMLVSSPSPCPFCPCSLLDLVSPWSSHRLLLFTYPFWFPFWVGCLLSSMVKNIICYSEVEFIVRHLRTNSDEAPLSLSSVSGFFRCWTSGIFICTSGFNPTQYFSDLVGESVWDWAPSLPWCPNLHFWYLLHPAGQPELGAGAPVAAACGQSLACAGTG